MRDAFRIDNGCRFLVLVIPNGCCDGRRRIVGGGLVTGGFQFVVVREESFSGSSSSISVTPMTVSVRALSRRISTWEKLTT